MVADLHLHEHQEHFFGLMIWLMPKIWGYQKIFGYIGCLFKHEKGDNSSQNSRSGEEFIKKTKQYYSVKLKLGIRDQ